MKFMIYDFKQELVVEENKTEIASKIESIINNYKNKKKIIIGDENGYPFFSFKKNENEELKTKGENNKALNEKLDQNLINNKNSREHKLYETINDKNDEKSVFLLKMCSLISFIIMLICGVLTLWYNLIYYNKQNKLFQIMSSTLNLKYCCIFSFNFFKELLLLNFNFSNLEGGIYKNIPAKNRAKYKALMKQKLIDYFLENQISLLNILPNDYILSEASNKKIEEVFESKYLENGIFGTMKGDLLSNLMQYNTALFNLAFSYNNLNQNHTDIFNFNQNCLGSFSIALISLIDIYNSELENLNKKISSFFVKLLIIIFIIFNLFCIFIVLSFISAAKIRTNYIRIFYSVDRHYIRDLISKCEDLINKLKKTHKDDCEEFEETSNNKISFINEKKENISQNNDLNNKNELKTKSLLSFTDKLYIVIYIVFIIITYGYFAVTFMVLFIYGKVALRFSNMLMKLNTIQSNTVELFNIYKEFLFDNKTEIYGFSSLDYLCQKEAESYTSVDNNIRIYRNELKKKSLFELLNRDICYYYITDFFNSTEDCRNYYGVTINYDYNFIFTNFIQSLRHAKNIAVYKHNTEYIFGNLTFLDVDPSKERESINITDKKVSFKLDLFNNDVIYSDLNNLIINIILPYIDENRKIVSTKVNIEGKGIYFFFYFGLFLLDILILNFAFLIPIIRAINKSIFKTKNLLQLIPMKILASQSHIESLLKAS